MNDLYRELMIGCGSRRQKDLRLPTAEEIRRFLGGQPMRPGVAPANVNRYGAEFQNLFTLDIEASHKPDVVFDLCELRYTGMRYRPLLDYPPHISMGKFSVNGTIDMDKYEAARRVYDQEMRDVDAWNRDSIMTENYYDEIHAYEVLEHIGAQGDYRLFFAQFSEFWRVLKPGGYFFGTCPAWHSPWAWGDPSHSRVLTTGTLAFLSQEEYAKQVGVTAMSDFRSIYKADFRAIMADESTDSLLFVLQAVKCEGCGLSRIMCDEGKEKGTLKCCPDCDHRVE